ncbi:hypothetical protein [Desulforamulus ferrireducens]|uniref:Uncharacterized protein n=1 Tax=Desulforamulus ferrireducens TaxID=1833852 RepID=A0A1S6IU54_9FIRM|nr:hypothetical protein [Desulforamulus ferrireducens]AQS58309.1 hypothetical protein B0537_03910 [Desulforamulus ferrireducens]
MTTVMRHFFFGSQPSAVGFNFWLSAIGHRPSAKILAIGLWLLAIGLVGLNLILVAHCRGNFI